MKKLTVLLLALSASSAFATEPRPIWTQQQQQLQLQGQIAEGGAGGAGGAGAATAETTIRGQLQIPVTNSAIPANNAQFTVCPVISPGAKAHSNWIFSNSEVSAETLVVNGICVCYYKSDKVEREACMHNYACVADKTYRKSNDATCPVE